MGQSDLPCNIEPEAKAFSKQIAEVGLRQAVKDRDAAFETPATRPDDAR